MPVLQTLLFTGFLHCLVFKDHKFRDTGPGDAKKRYGADFHSDKLSSHHVVTLIYTLVAPIEVFKNNTPNDCQRAKYIVSQFIPPKIWCQTFFSCRKYLIRPGSLEYIRCYQTTSQELLSLFFPNVKVAL